MKAIVEVRQAFLESLYLSIYSFRCSPLDLYPKISVMTSFRKHVSQRVLRKAPRKARKSSMDNTLNDRIFKQKLVCRLKWSRSFSLCNQIYWNWSRNARTSKSFRFVTCSDLSSRPVTVPLPTQDRFAICCLLLSCEQDRSKQQIAKRSCVGGGTVTLTVYMPANWFSCRTLPLACLWGPEFSKDAIWDLRETTLRKWCPGVRRFVLKLVRLIPIRPSGPHSICPKFGSIAPYSPYSRRHFRTSSSTSPPSLTSQIQNEAIHRAISEKCGTAMWPPSTNQIACNKSLM